MFQRRQQKGAELSLFAGQVREKIFLQQPREKCLRQILRVLLGVTAPADVGVKRKPVGPAQFLQRGVRLRRVPPARREHDRPVRRGEDVARRGRGRRGMFGCQSKVMLTTDIAGEHGISRNGTGRQPDNPGRLLNDLGRTTSPAGRLPGDPGRLPSPEGILRNDPGRL